MTPQIKQAPMRILQFGEGNFLRTFIDWMVDRMRAEAGFDGSVGLVKTIPGPFSPDFERQDNAYTVVIRGRADGQVVDQTSRIDVIAGRFNPYEDFQGYLDAAANPGLRVIVSNTTEAGIVLNLADRAEDRPAPSYPGKLTQLLRARYQALGGGPGSALLILPCELIEKNGQTLRQHVLAHAARWYGDPAFEHWIARDCTFVDSLVDRIVSGHDPEARKALLAQTGFDDALLSVGEPYHLLAIQGAEREDLLPFRRAGLNVVWTDDINPYRLLKVRILNGGHTFLAMVGTALGVTQVRGCLNHPALRPALECLYGSEIIPALPKAAAHGEAYARTILDRFDNPFMEHKLEDIALNSVSKWRSRLLPSALDYTAATGAVPSLIAFSLAALIERYTTVAGLKDDACVLAAFDGLKDLAAGDPAAAARRALADPAIWGEPLPAIPGFELAVVASFQEIRALGVAVALDRAVARAQAGARS
jgi:mannitol-1-phosphate/altronate dehydrogenase